ncbi:MAG TPA: LysR family transcriptional regulator [Ornithinimicrobium sp.]|uniref:LysR family transcriptional regulator n=1 Tax=Ornithinimicrobium sp. TaxID=1977084 RepID=UPI002B4A91AF|nr:LysR family transcriptional regulator [Ornithinimicrobium sp.]HKJ12801.1 LysR family transcriptional regulator [Ornithinimicrobium sp.]
MSAHPWPDLSALELIVSISEQGSLGAGARAVGMAQPNASRLVARMEREMGVALLQRSPRGSTLTPRGAVIVDWARAVLTAADDMLVGVEALRHDGPAPLSVAASMTIAEHLLPAWLAELKVRHPDTAVALDVVNSAQVIEGVRAGCYRVGFIESSEPPRDLHRAQVATDHLAVVVSATHPWSRRVDPLTAQQLAESPLVLREPGSGTRAAWESALEAATGTSRGAPAALSLSSNAAVSTAVRAGAGPGVLSRYAVAGSVERGDLCEVPTVGLDLERRLHALWNGPRRLDGSAGDLVALARRAKPT